MNRVLEFFFMIYLWWRIRRNMRRLKRIFEEED